MGSGHKGRNQMRRSRRAGRCTGLNGVRPQGPESVHGIDSGFPVNLASMGSGHKGRNQVRVVTAEMVMPEPASMGSGHKGRNQSAL